MRKINTAYFSFFTILLITLLSETVNCQNYIGTWKGEATQLDDEMDKWNVIMTIEDNSSIITFPSLDCGGTLTFVRKECNSFIFNENIKYGRENCLTGLSIRFSLLSDKYMHWEEIDSLGQIISFATLRRETVPKR